MNHILLSFLNQNWDDFIVFVQEDEGVSFEDAEAIAEEILDYLTYHNF